jgi:hypothetical protein
MARPGLRRLFLSIGRDRKKLPRPAPDNYLRLRCKRRCFLRLCVLIFFKCRFLPQPTKSLLDAFPYGFNCPY